MIVMDQNRNKSTLPARDKRGGGNLTSSQPSNGGDASDLSLENF